MQIKTFTGRGSSAVLAMIKEDLGPDAVILDTREENGAVTMTAATERPRPAQQASGMGVYSIGGQTSRFQPPGPFSAPPAGAFSDAGAGHPAGAGFAAQSAGTPQYAPDPASGYAQGQGAYPPDNGYADPAYGSTASRPRQMPLPGQEQSMAPPGQGPAFTAHAGQNAAWSMPAQPGQGAQSGYFADPYAQELSARNAQAMAGSAPGGAPFARAAGAGQPG
ncbi:hypothetical protein LJC59_04730, partial [Desulfovibrio sp. OttesenSCG-928-A18]|nr:hypothetical protein [Desulfovibrio sp. OttesenSCG-928-A18]